METGYRISINPNYFSCCKQHDDQKVARSLRPTFCNSGEGASRAEPSSQAAQAPYCGRTGLGFASFSQQAQQQSSRGSGGCWARKKRESEGKKASQRASLAGERVGALSDAPPPHPPEAATQGAWNPGSLNVPTGSRQRSKLERSRRPRLHCSLSPAPPYLPSPQLAPGPPAPLTPFLPNPTPLYLSGSRNLPPQSCGLAGGSQPRCMEYPTAC